MGFSIRLGEAVGEALGEAEQAIGRRLAEMTGPTAPEQPQEADEPQETALPSWEALEGANPEELAEEPAALHTVHAHAVVTDEGLAVLHEVPTTDNPEGLHTREEVNGRGKYHRAENPVPGEVYYLRDHRRHWNPVRFTSPEAGS
jgi:hypothetical protein